MSVFAVAGVAFQDNLPQVAASPCVIWFQDGKIVANRIVKNYLGEATSVAIERVWSNPAEAPGNDKARLRAVRVLDDD